MELQISGRFSHAHTPFCCWFFYLTMIVRNMFSVPALFLRDCVCIWVGGYGYKSCSATSYIFKSLDITSVLYASYLSMTMYSPFIVPLHVYIENKASLTWDWHSRDVLSFAPFFTILLS